MDKGLSLIHAIWSNIINKYFCRRGNTNGEFKSETF